MASASLADPAATLAPNVRAFRAAGKAAAMLTASADLDVARIGIALAQWVEEGGSTPLDRALGLRGTPGSRSAATQAILDQRELLLAITAAEFWPGLGISEQARQLQAQWARYAAAGWTRERTAPLMPPARLGTPEGRFWQILKLRDHVMAERSVRAALAASSLYSLPSPAATLPAEQET